MKHIPLMLMQTRIIQFLLYKPRSDNYLTFADKNSLSLLKPFCNCFNNDLIFENRKNYRIKCDKHYLFQGRMQERKIVFLQQEGNYVHSVQYFIMANNEKIYIVIVDM